MRPVRTRKLALAAALLVISLFAPAGTQNQAGDAQANFEGPGSPGNW